MNDWIQKTNERNKQISESKNPRIRKKKNNRRQNISNT